jgi:hypothetical protein
VVEHRQEQLARSPRRSCLADRFAQVARQAHGSSRCLSAGLTTCAGLQQQRQLLALLAGQRRRRVDDALDVIFELADLDRAARLRDALRRVAAADSSAESLAGALSR